MENHSSADPAFQRASSQGSFKVTSPGMYDEGKPKKIG
jgi:hypothetical protein